jgi:hypothetical protein
MYWCERRDSSGINECAMCSRVEVDGNGINESSDVSRIDWSSLDVRR